MEKLKILADFEEMLKVRFKGRKTPVNKEFAHPELKSFNDSRFEEWRKKR